MKRLALFIPLVAIAPLWVGALPPSPTAAGTSGGFDGLPAGGVLCDVSQGFALAVPDGDDVAGGDTATPAGATEKDACALEGQAGPSAVAAGLLQLPAAPVPAAPPSAARRPAVAAPAVLRTSPAPVRLTNGATPRLRKMRMRVTGYCPCRECCGKWSAARRTASGASVYANRSRFVAADTDVLPFGSRVSVPGYHDGRTVPVLDRGSQIVGRRLDVFFLSHAEAKRWGTRWLTVGVYPG